jgi:hypothetical protein
MKDPSLRLFHPEYVPVSSVWTAWTMAPMGRVKHLARPEQYAAFTAWVPLRRAKVHGTHGEVIGLRAIRDHVALRPPPQTPYVGYRREGLDPGSWTRVMRLASA